MIQKIINYFSSREITDCPYEVRKSRTNLIRGMSYPEDNKYIKQIRDEEERNPAPFSDRVIVIDYPVVEEVDKDYLYEEEAYIDIETGEKLPEGVMNISITKILGIDGCAKMRNCEGATFKEILFEEIWGQSLTEETMEYFTSNCMKAEGYEGFTNMPEDPDKKIGGSIARGGITMNKIEDGYFIVSNGKHRVIMAMYAIYQKDGKNGLLRKVKVS